MSTQEAVKDEAARVRLPSRLPYTVTCASAWL